MTIGVFCFAVLLSFLFCFFFLLFFFMYRLNTSIPSNIFTTNQIFRVHVFGWCNVINKGNNKIIWCYYYASKVYRKHIDNSSLEDLPVYICKVNYSSCHNSNPSTFLLHVTESNPSYQLYSCLMRQVDVIYLLWQHISSFFCVYDFLCILRNMYYENGEINKVDIFVNSWKNRGY